MTFRHMLLKLVLAAPLVACGGHADDTAAVDSTTEDSTPGADDPVPVPRAPASVDIDSEPRHDEPPSNVDPAGMNEAPLQPAPNAVAPVPNQLECVALPPMPPLAPTLDVAEGCTLVDLGPLSDEPMNTDDARPLLVGRWQLCGDAAPFSGVLHDGLEFGENGRVQLLERSDAGLAPMAAGTKGVFILLGTGQLMFRHGLEQSQYASFARFDPTFGAFEFEDAGTLLRYVRIQADPESAAANVPTTASSSCSMEGVWDTSEDSSNPPASFAFDAKGEWIGGPRGSDLCTSATMYGTFELQSSEFTLTTNVGAGACAYWFDTGYSARFSEDCNQVALTQTYDNCTGGRGYMNQGEVLLRR